MKNKINKIGGFVIFWVYILFLGVSALSIKLGYVRSVYTYHEVTWEKFWEQFPMYFLVISIGAIIWYFYDKDRS